MHSRAVDWTFSCEVVSSSPDVSSTAILDINKEGMVTAPFSDSLLWFIFHFGCSSIGHCCLLTWKGSEQWPLLREAHQMSQVHISLFLGAVTLGNFPYPQFLMRKVGSTTTDQYHLTLSSWEALHPVAFGSSRWPIPFTKGTLVSD